MTALETRAGNLRQRPTWPAGTEAVAVSALKPYARNARTHSRRQIKKIAASISRFGFVNPVLIDENNQIIAGHGRVAGAKLLGWREVPTLRIEHLDETEKRAYILADNRLAEEAGWDKEILAIELRWLIDFLLIRDTPPVGMYVLNMFCMRGSRLWGSRLHRACVV